MKKFIKQNPILTGVLFVMMGYLTIGQLTLPEESPAATQEERDLAFNESKRWEVIWQNGPHKIELVDSLGRFNALGLWKDTLHVHVKRSYWYKLSYEDKQTMIDYWTEHHKK